MDGLKLEHPQAQPNLRVLIKKNVYANRQPHNQIDFNRLLLVYCSKQLLTQPINEQRSITISPSSIGLRFLLSIKWHRPHPLAVGLF